MKRRYWLAALLLAAALGGCFFSGETPEKVDYPEGAGGPEGLFIFYHMEGYQSENYGLVDAKGNVVLPFEYDSINVVQQHNYYGGGGKNKGERFYQVGLYYPDSEGQLMNWRYALASPQGELLTEFRYMYIAWTEPGVFAAVVDADTPECVMLDRGGAESPITDPLMLSELEELASRWGNMDYYYDLALSKTGPDVPDGGFDYVINLSGGMYWGGYYKNQEQLDVMDADKEAYIDNRVTELFDKGGNRVGEYHYSFVSRITDDVWLGENDTYDPDAGLTRQQYYLIAPTGERLNSQIYEMIWYWNPDPYLVARQGEEIVVLDCGTLEETWRFPLDPARDGSIYTSEDGKQFFAATAPTNALELPVVYNLSDKTSLELTRFPGGWVHDVCQGGERIIVYCENSLVDVPEIPDQEASYSFLVDGNGDPLLTYASELYSNNGYLVARQVYGRGDWGEKGLSGVFDMDGNQLLPYEFSRIELLDGNAMHVVRGDWEGIMDMAGNWIYKQSVFTGLEE